MNAYAVPIITTKPGAIRLRVDQVISIEVIREYDLAEFRSARFPNPTLPQIPIHIAAQSLADAKAAGRA